MSLLQLTLWTVVSIFGLPGLPLFLVPKSEPVAAVGNAGPGFDGANRRFWVFFTDKAILSMEQLNSEVSARAAELPGRTLRRRSSRGNGGAMLVYRDLALAPDYVAAVLGTGVVLRHESRWLNAISVEATAAQIRAISLLPMVRRIQPVARAMRRRPFEERPVATAETRDNGRSWYGPSYDQLNQMGIVAAQNAGYTGAGVVIGVLDSGFNRTHSAFNQTTNGAHPIQILAEHDFVANDADTTQQPGDPSGQSSHGTYVLGILGAYQPMGYVGGAFDASYILAKTEDISEEVPAEEDNFVAGLEWIESLGADVCTSSLGYLDWYTQADLDGETAVTTIAVNIATANGLICCNAAGNEGHDADPDTSHLIAPADAFEVITCGAVNSNGDIAGFSSDGPSADGRVKPELLARGEGARSVSFNSNMNFATINGTSFSTPLTAAGVALIVQAHPGWTVSRVRRALFHTASDFLVNSAFDPVYVRGYGVVDVLGAIEFVHSDINGDGAADGRDIEPFVTALLGTNLAPAEVRRADCDASGEVGLSDIPFFVTDLLGN